MASAFGATMSRSQTATVAAVTQSRRAFGITAMFPTLAIVTGAATRHSPSPKPGTASAFTPRAVSAIAHAVVPSAGIVGLALGVGTGLTGATGAAGVADGELA